MGGMAAWLRRARRGARPRHHAGAGPRHARRRRADRGRAAEGPLWRVRYRGGGPRAGRRGRTPRGPRAAAALSPRRLDRPRPGRPRGPAARSRCSSIGEANALQRLPPADRHPGPRGLGQRGVLHGAGRGGGRAAGRSGSVARHGRQADRSRTQAAGRTVLGAALVVAPWARPAGRLDRRGREPGPGHRARARPRRARRRDGSGSAAHAG